jgi:hypothetical protein
MQIRDCQKEIDELLSLELFEQWLFDEKNKYTSFLRCSARHNPISAYLRDKLKYDIGVFYTVYQIDLDIRYRPISQEWVKNWLAFLDCNFTQRTIPKASVKLYWDKFKEINELCKRLGAKLPTFN